jgi:hypothetical protein
VKDTVEALLRHRRKFFSREGEDGLLDYIMSRIPDPSGWCVEFGAWDGISESNTHYLIAQKDYRGVMIEADALKYRRLCENMSRYGTICLNAFVRPEGPCSLHSLLSQTPIPKDFDLLSIDVDGEDYYVWKHLEKYAPKLVIIEINLRDKPGIRRIHNTGAPIALGNARVNSPTSLGMSVYTGTSITSMTELANKKGYSLLANVHCNALYIRREYLNLFHDREVTPEEVFTYEEHGIGALNFRELLGLGWKRVLAKCILRR